MATTNPITDAKITPRIIIHGGAGNITRTSISRDKYDAYQNSLRHILSTSASLLAQPGATALDVATHAVSMLEDDPLYNSGKGAVFTRAGTNELECSIMVSNGYQKRGVGCMLISHIKNPTKLAREILVRGELKDGGGAEDHCEYSGEAVEELAREWGLEIVDPSYYFTQGRWDEHKRGLKEEQMRTKRTNDAFSEPTFVEMNDWEKANYIPLGTCGAVVLDSFGTICTATSTGGLTNKMPGRIGDTPTMGAGFWAEEWFEETSKKNIRMLYQRPISVSPVDRISQGDVGGLVGDCLPSLTRHSYTPISDTKHEHTMIQKPRPVRHAVGVSGTGNGDSFLRMAASRTVAAKSRFTPTSLSEALTWMSGRGGELQKSAGDRWGHVHEGVGGMIGIELVGTKVTVVSDYNCGGMFRAWTEEDGSKKCLVFRKNDYESGPREWNSV